MALLFAESAELVAVVWGQLFVVAMVANHWRWDVRKPAIAVGVYEWSEWKAPLAFVGKNIDDHW